MQNDDEICKERDDFSMKFVFIFFYTPKNQRIILRYSHYFFFFFLQFFCCFKKEIQNNLLHNHKNFFP